MKTRMSYLYIYFALVLLQSCSSTNADIETLAGYYIYGHEANSFKPCGQKLVYWVLSDDEMLKNMAEKYSHYAASPYDEVFVEIKGDFIDKASNGFAADYDGQIQLTSVLLMKKKSASACKSFSFRL